MILYDNFTKATYDQQDNLCTTSMCYQDPGTYRGASNVKVFLHAFSRYIYIDHLRILKIGWKYMISVVHDLSGSLSDFIQYAVFNGLITSSTNKRSKIE